MTRTDITNLSLAGAFLAAGAGVLFSFNDMAIKFLSDGFALHQIVLVRAVIGIGFVLAVIAATGSGMQQLRTARPFMHAARALTMISANATFFLGIAAMPLADAVAIAFVAPVFISLLSWTILREPVGPHRLGAVLVGLAGAMVMMRPGTGVIAPAALLVLVSALLYALAQILTRLMRETESAVALSFFVHLGFLLTALLFGALFGDGRLEGRVDPLLAFLFRPWVWPSAQDWPLLLATGVAVAIGGLMMAQAYRLSEAALVAPFEYVALPMAVFWGFVVFGTLPDTTAVAGMALIVAAGLYTLWRETRRGKPPPNITGDKP